MKKVYVGGFNSCLCHNEKSIINSIVRHSDGYCFVDKFQDADIIVLLDTCVATYINFINVLDGINKVLKWKKKDSEVIVSGCFARGNSLEAMDEQEEILKQVELVSPDKICEVIAKKIFVNNSVDIADDLVLPTTITDSTIKVSPVSGCMNKCSFCKSNYMNFDLKSVPFEYLEKLKVRMDEVNTNYLLNYIRIGSSNLSLYGVDLYKEQRAHEAIKILTGADCIKWAEVGALINFYPKLINEIINNEKIKSVFISLESGSERVYNLMNRPIPLNKLKEIIKLIRKERPDILINTEIICGFPTETLSDLYKSIDTLYELDINPQFLHPYMNSYCVPSSKLQQHSLDKCIELVRYAEERLIGLSSKFNKFVRDGEKIVVSKDDELRLYSLMSIDGTVDYDFYDEFEEEYEVNDVFNRSLVKKYK